MNLRRILVVKLADVGDLLMISPALVALHRAYPQAQIDVLAPPTSAATLLGLPHVDNVLRFDKFGFDRPAALLNPRRWAEGIEFVRTLRAPHYDAVAIMHHLTTRFGAIKFAALALASGAKIRAGLDNGRGWFLTHRVADNGFGAMHEAAYWQQVATLLDGDATPQPLTFSPREADKQKAATLVAQLPDGGPIVAIHPGTGAYAPARRWPSGYFAQLARRLRDDLNARIVIVGGPDVREWAANIVTAAGLADDPACLNLSEQTTLGELAALLAHCQLYIGSDSGPLHIATASGVPVLGIYGPSNHRAWGPYSPDGSTAEFDALTQPSAAWPTPRRHAVLRQSLACSPCLYREHAVGLRNGCPPRECLDTLTPDAAFAAAKKMLEGLLLFRQPPRSIKVHSGGDNCGGNTEVGNEGQGEQIAQHPCEGEGHRHRISPPRYLISAHCVAATVLPLPANCPSPNHDDRNNDDCCFHNFLQSTLYLDYNINVRQVCGG